jgi:hypothetical protein
MDFILYVKIFVFSVNKTNISANSKPSAKRLNPLIMERGGGLIDEKTDD